MYPKLKVSIVNYSNTLPLYYGIMQSDLLPDLELHLDYPSMCAEKLKNGLVDIGLVPVAILGELSDYYIISEWCIGAEKNVDTVKLYAECPLNEIKTLQLDYQSRTSVELIKILCKNYWKINPEFIESKEGYEKDIKGKNAALIIGDRTFEYNGKFTYEFDLAQAWREYTGLPMVFAVWVSTKPIEHKGFLQEFERAQEKGVAHISDAIKHFKKKNSEELIDYLENKISYPFDARKKAALSLFLRLIKK